MTHYANRPFTVQWFLLGVVTLLSSIIVGAELYRDRLDKGRIEQDRLQAQARVITDNVGFLLRAGDAVLRHVLDELPSWRQGAGYHPAAADAWHSYFIMPGIRTLLVTDAQGVVQLSNRRELRHQNLSYRDYFQIPRQHPDHNTLYLSPPFQSVLNVFVMNLSRAIINPDGSFAGVVTMSFEPTHFQTLMNSVLYAPDMQVTIAHGAGKLFLQVPGHDLYPGAAWPVPEDLANTPEDGTMRPAGSLVHSTNGERLGVVGRIQPADLHMDKPLFVAVSRLSAPIYADWTRDVQLYGGLFVSMVLVVGITLHVTQRRTHRSHEQARQAEAALDKSDRQQRAILDHTPAVVFLKDLQGRYLFINHQYERLFHVTDLAIRGKTDHDLFPSEVAAMLRENDRQALTRGTIAVEERMPQDDGVHVYLSVKFALRAEDGGSPYAVCGIATDITDRKQAEEVLRNAREEALQASRAKSHFLAAMSHEIRTPMNAIIGMGDVLQETALDAEQRRHLQTMIHAGAVLMGLINDILDLSKIEAGQMELEGQPFDLPLLLAETVEVMQVSARTRGIVLRMQRGDDVPRMVQGDAQRLKQVLFNLLDNANKFTRRGEVLLAVTGQGEDRVRFAVTDTGIGIPDQQLAVIFEPFVQADGEQTCKRFGGTGLGLSICNHLVQRMGGDLQVHSQVGVGSTFFFAIPLKPVVQSGAPDPAPPAGPAIDPAVPPAGLRILAVDDAEDNLYLLAAFLQNTPHELTTAQDGAQALALFQTRPFDLVLMDIQMPVMDGYETTRAMRQWESTRPGPATPIMAFTAHAMKEVSEEVLAAGCNAVLTKPIRKRGLLAVLAQVQHSTI
ncbi:MAG: ATP-binding protein [Magnetococcus sp. DMHC-8]